MPIYVFKCSQCEVVEEDYYKITETCIVRICNNCLSMNDDIVNMEKIIPQSSTFILKGDCWAKDGYKK